MKTLKNVMLINALSSGITGLMLVIFPSDAARLFGHAQNLPFAVVGIFLIAFAALVFVQGRKTPVNKNWLKLIIAVDVLWVVDSLIVIAPQLFSLSSIGYYLIAAVAVWVALMAFLQIKGLKEISMSQV